jgi:hypothetical protein
MYQSSSPASSIATKSVSTCAISIYRIQTLRIASTTQDPTWDNAGAATWSFLELTVGVLAACLPTLRPIFVKTLRRQFGAAASDSKSGNPNSAYPRVDSNVWQGSKYSTRKGVSRIEDTGSTEDLNQKGDHGYGLTELNGGGDSVPGAYSVSVGGGGRDSDVSLAMEGSDSLEMNKKKWGINTTIVVSQTIDIEEGGGITA